ncbi:uncharacterized protein LOC129776551 [Toxorhynchites rutilus septentrionalis]|uniref:uncharacterized protein LOC129776551 n=1 Tax=Toxorhynchites rutilus septentrionalis TaxID=329112 RepID=UPI002479CC6E|nr:uncharacterized protein LOC129776551 [Toxorhynchites rutilus septentrionalis]
MDGCRYSRVARVHQNCSMLLVPVIVLACSALLCARGAASDRLGSVQQFRKLIEPDALLFRLDRLLDMCIAHYEDLTTDLLLGVAIANGQLKSILTHPNVNNRIFLETLQKKCDYVESRIDSIFSYPSSSNAIVCKLLINANFWMFTEEAGRRDSLQSSARDLTIDQRSHRQTRGRHTLRDYLLALDVGAPTRLQSDECLSELLVKDSENELNSTAYSPSLHAVDSGRTNPLFLSRECSAAMSIRNKSYGYHLTHKLLFYLILDKLRFSNIEQGFVSAAKDKLCNQILHESRLIVELRYPEVFRDLFMEQVFLCAYAGFTEFRNQTWLGTIVGWQNSNGCLNDGHDSGLLEMNTLTAQCSTHMTGLGAALLGLFSKLQMIG